MTKLTQNTATNAVRRGYSRPSLTVYGSVRELTGAMSGVGTDSSSMFMTGVMA
ncbi:MAG: hypothetical protein RIS85_54 [Pseudomonadota bacterium]